jgi:hypothetical protein
MRWKPAIYTATAAREQQGASGSLVPVLLYVSQRLQASRPAGGVAALRCRLTWCACYRSFEIGDCVVSSAAVISLPPPPGASATPGCVLRAACTVLWTGGPPTGARLVTALDRGLLCGVRVGVWVCLAATPLQHPGGAVLPGAVASQSGPSGCECRRRHAERLHGHERRGGARLAPAAGCIHSTWLGAVARLRRASPPPPQITTARCKA